MADDSKKRTGRAGAAGGGRNKEKLTDAEVLEVRRILSQGGLTNKTESPDSATAPSPCAQESAGFLICNGTDMEVVSFPAGGPWVVQVTNGVITFAQPPGANAAPEQAPAPRENGAGESNGGQPPNLI